MAGDVMARLTKSDLERRIADLEAENIALRAGAGGEAIGIAPTTPRRRSRGWAVLSAALIVIGVVLAPVGVIATWAKADLTDTDRFVSSFAPLAKDDAVQKFITDETVSVIDDTVDIPNLTSEVLDGIASLGTPPRATAALEALKGPAAAGIRSLIQSQITSFVASEAFSDVWETALRVSHKQLMATMANDADAAVTLGDNGEIGIQLGPIIEAAKLALVEQGLGFASEIPAINRTVTVAQSDAIPAVQFGYGAAVAAGTWLPLMSLLLMATGVFVAKRRSVALIATAVGLALSMVVLAILFAVGQALFVSTMSAGTIPSGVASVLFETVVAGMRGTTVAVLTLAVVVAVVGWAAGPFELPRRLRSLGARAAAGVRRFAGERGVTTGYFGRWLFDQRVLVRAAIAVVASLVIFLVRPLTPGLIVCTLVLALAALVLVELVQRPPDFNEFVDEDIAAASAL